MLQKRPSLKRAWSFCYAVYMNKADIRLLIGGSVIAISQMLSRGLVSGFVLLIGILILTAI